MMMVESPGGMSRVTVILRSSANCCIVRKGMVSESTMPPSGSYCE